MPEIEATERDLVTEVEELLETHSIVAMRVDKPYKEIRPLLHRLVEEVKTLRAHVADLNHDMEEANKHCEEYHEVRTGY